MPKLLIATHNKHKLQEFQSFLEPLGITVIGAENIPETTETGTTFQENALQKALWAGMHSGLPTLADDSGLCVHVLNDAPGLYSARFAAEHGGYPGAFQELFHQLQNKTDWSAHFCCCLCLVLPQQTPQFFVGKVNGCLVSKPDTSLSDFGYDPIFMPDGFDKTFGGLPAEVKQKLSHRGRALEELVAYLKDHPLPEEEK